MREVLLFLLIIALVNCTGNEGPRPSKEDVVGPVLQPMAFEQFQIIDSAKWWWALTVGDVTSDGLMDIIAINNNAQGGYLAFYAAVEQDTIWQETIIAAEPPTGGTFASGDLEAGDMDGDGDTDVLAVKHTGEWDDAAAPAELFWYENQGSGATWQAHTIGDAPDAVKDLSIADFDGDGRQDIAVLTFDEGNISVHRQLANGTFARVLNLDYPNLHEGMDTGDFNGDGLPDILANGNIFINPGGDLTGNWATDNVDEQWNNQTGDWSRNATKGFAVDINGDKIDEIFISHSERAGYPLMMYTYQNDAWLETTIVDRIPACHTLQVFDMDLDGDLDIVAGTNPARAVNLGVEASEVYVIINQGDDQEWELRQIEDGGIYNGRVIDFEGDGDYDIFRYPNHEARQLFLLRNQVR